VENGKYKISFKPDKLRPIKDYMKLQRRFRHLPEDTVEEIQKRTEQEYRKLLEKA